MKNDHLKILFIRVFTKPLYRDFKAILIKINNYSLLFLFYFFILFPISIFNRIINKKYLDFDFHVPSWDKIK